MECPNSAYEAPHSGFVKHHCPTDRQLCDEPRPQGRPRTDHEKQPGVNEVGGVEHETQEANEAHGRIVQNVSESRSPEA
jgi:hypothetical protein